VFRRGIAILACGVGVALTGCGAQEAEVVKGAFEKDISSANIEVAFKTQAGQGATSVKLAGPYKSNGKGELPSADLAVQIMGAAPATINGRLISTGKNAFIEYGGETYEIGEATIAELQKSGGSSGQLTPNDIKTMMGQMQDWFPESDTQEQADLDGEPVTRVTGQLDLSAALTDLKELAKRPGMSATEGLKELSRGDIKRIERMFSDPRFTLDVGRDDGKLRRIVATMKMDNGSEQGAMEFSIRFKDVDKPVTIDAPAAGSGKPIEELGKQLEQDFGGAAGGATEEQIN
jgi:hypothetical protein